MGKERKLIQIKGGKKMPATVMSDDERILLKTLVAKHKHEGLEYDVNPIFCIVEDTLIHCSTLSFEGATTGDLARVEDRSHHPGFTRMPETLSTKIERISCEISGKTLNGVDAHSTTVAIFDMLTMYKWNEKIVLALAAFTLTYGEFWLLAHIHDTYQFAKTMAILKQLPSIMEHASSLKPRFDTLNDLVSIILEVTKCVIEFHDMPTQTQYIPVACYWTVRSIVSCTAQITSLTALGYEIFTPTDTWELSTLTFTLISIIDHIRQLPDSHSEYIGRPLFNLSTGSASKMDDESYATLHDLFSKPNTDNMKVLKALIYAQDDILPLYDCIFKKRVSLEPLRRKNVMLLISGLEISLPEIRLLNEIVRKFKLGSLGMLRKYEWVWIPIVDPDSEWIEPKQKQFESVREKMSWYTVYHLSLIGKPVISFIKREWKYKNKLMIVVLDPQGGVSCPNAIYMLSIWADFAYPFTRSREEDLWKEFNNLNLELLSLTIEEKVSNWILSGKYFFVYGGVDIEWIRKFVKEARRVEMATQVPLEMVYVGKSNKGEQVQKINDTIICDKLNTHYWSNKRMLWYFWFHLQNILLSKLQVKQTDHNNDHNAMHEIKNLLSNDDDDDDVMHEIKKILCYDKHGGWILLAKGDQIEVIGNATTALQTLVEYDITWKEHANRHGFGQAFRNHYNKVNSVVGSCCKFEFSPKMERVPEPLTCPECRANMHVITTFQCCHDEKIDDDFFFSIDAPPPI